MSDADEPLIRSDVTEVRPSASPKSHPTPKSPPDLSDSTTDEYEVPPASRKSRPTPSASRKSHPMPSTSREGMPSTSGFHPLSHGDLLAATTDEDGEEEDEDSVRRMSACFLREITHMADSSGKNKRSMTLQEKREKIRAVQAFRLGVGAKKPIHYAWDKRFSVHRDADGKDHLTTKLGRDGTNSYKTYLAMEEIFAKIYTKHHMSGHAGRDRLYKELEHKYANISKEHVSIFLSLCTVCQQTKPRSVQTLQINPILEKDFNDRIQIDLINFQQYLNPGNYNYILVWQDHLTKFVQLRPLKKKEEGDVVHALCNIFCTFGAPGILHSDNGREFINRAMNKLLSVYPQIEHRTGRARHPQTQGSVESANKTIKHILLRFMNECGEKDWVSLLDMVTMAKNSTYHTGIQMSPYQALLGVKMKTPVLQLEDEEGNLSAHVSKKLGLMHEATKIPVEEEARLSASEDEPPPEEQEETPCYSCSRPCSETCGNCRTPIHKDCADSKGHCPLCQRADTRKQSRKRASESLENQAARMRKKVARPPPSSVEVGDTVVITIPVADRDTSGQRNMHAVVARINRFGERLIYKLATRSGHIQRSFARDGFTPCRDKTKINLIDCHKKIIPLRTAIRAQSRRDVEDNVCHCTTGCQAFKCSCHKSQKLCTSKCHRGKPCRNQATDEVSTRKDDSLYCSCRGNCAVGCPCHAQKRVCHVKCHSGRDTPCINVGLASNNLKGCGCKLGCALGRCKCRKTDQMCTYSCHKGHRCDNLMVPTAKTM